MHTTWPGEFLASHAAVAYAQILQLFCVICIHIYIFILYIYTYIYVHINYWRRAHGSFLNSLKTSAVGEELHQY